MIAHYTIVRLRCLISDTTGTMTIIGIIAVLLYAVAWFLLARHWKLSTQAGTSARADRYPLTIWLLASVCNAVVLYYPLLTEASLSLDFISSTAHVMWLAGLVLLITSLTHAITSISLIMLPLVITALLAHLSASHNPTELSLASGMGMHVLSALLAYSILMLAALLALIIAYQHYFLHSRRSNSIIRTLPALQDMDALLFRSILAGLILLSITLLSGFFYMEDLFGSQIAHKTILSILAWLIFSVLLYGRWKHGWRGLTATRWTLCGYALLMLAFFGTKFIREYLLTQ